MGSGRNLASEPAVSQVVPGSPVNVLRQEDLLLKVQGVSKTYDGWSKALNDVCLSMQHGEFVSIIGSSGAGKSTLLRCVNRLIDPSQGSIVFDGREITRERGRALRQTRRRISMVFQHYNLVYRATAIENVLHGRLGYRSTLAGMVGHYREDEKRRAFDILDQVGLADFAYTRTDQLSGGQKQRVGIARALVQDPLLILADEPIASLDPKSSRTVMEHLRWAADELGIACLVNLHQVDFALEFSDRIVGLRGGQVVFDGAPNDLDAAAIADIYGTDEAKADATLTAGSPWQSSLIEAGHRFDAPPANKEDAA
ncbi:MAG: phosphonate ABC transporter ATP-binding protein [Gordonibacter sp.]|nr:phosphonate ABC transporter ATP-binding protein [Gordonibacter sp.]